MPHILVVEDSRFSRHMIVGLLKDAGHDVSEAVNGEEGLNFFRENRPDCVVTDLLMPVMNGQEMVRQIRAIDSEVPIIVASADIQKTSREACEKLGISKFILKPNQAAEILVAIDTALSQEVGGKFNAAQ